MTSGPETHLVAVALRERPFRGAYYLRVILFPSGSLNEVVDGTFDT